MIWFTINGGGDATLQRLARSMEKIDFTLWRILVQGKSGASLETLRGLKRWYGDRVSIALYPFNLGAIGAWNENLSWFRHRNFDMPFVNCDDDIQIVDPGVSYRLQRGLGLGFLSCANKVSFFGERKPHGSEISAVGDHATALAAYHSICAEIHHDWRLVQYGHDTDWHRRLKKRYSINELSVDWSDSVVHHNQTGTYTNFQREAWGMFLERDQQFAGTMGDPPPPPVEWWRLPGYVIEI